MPGPTPTMQRFAEFLLAGDTQVVAYAKSYRGRAHWKKASLASAASKLFHTEVVQTYYQERLALLQAKEQEETGWTREEAMKILREILSQNMEEQLRCIENLEAQVLDLMEDFEGLDGDERAECLVKIRKLRSYRIVTNTRNGGVLGAVDALNRMQGFNEETLNINAGIVFAGEENLED